MVNSSLSLLSIRAPESPVPDLALATSKQQALRRIVHSVSDHPLTSDPSGKRCFYRVRNTAGRYPPSVPHHLKTYSGNFTGRPSCVDVLET